MSKRKIILNYGSATSLLGVSFMMFLHVFFFVFELSNHSISFVVGAIVVSFEFYGNKAWTICTRHTVLIFFISVVILKLILDLSIGANLSHVVTEF